VHSCEIPCQKDARKKHVKAPVMIALHFKGSRNTAKFKARLAEIAAVISHDE